MRGFNSWKRSQVNPARSSTPGPKFSTTMSQRLTSSSMTALPLRRLHVDGDAALVRVQHREIEAVGALHVLQLAAGDVAAAGQFDLDHVGAHPRQQLGPGRPRLDMGHIEDADAFEALLIFAIHSPSRLRMARVRTFPPAPLSRKSPCRSTWVPSQRVLARQLRVYRENRRAARHARRAPRCARAPAARRTRGRGVRAPR